MGVIYRHASMDLTDFDCNYLNKLLENIAKDEKSIFLLEDFNANLLNYNEHNQTNEFLDSTLNFMSPFYGWGSTTSRLQPLREGSLLFTTKFPEIPGTHFIDLGRMKG